MGNISDSKKNVKITNITSGKTYDVSQAEADVISGNIHTKNLFKIEKQASLPELSGKITKGSDAPQSADGK